MQIALRASGWTLIALVLGCRADGRVAAEPGPPPPGSHSTTAPVVREASLVVFWLAASDTLEASDGADLLDDFRYYTRAATPWFEDQGIPVITTNSDTIIVESEGVPRRAIMLTGLDYPFGYVLVDPGYAEEILTGVLTDDDLLDEADGYFGSDDSEDADSIQRAERSGSGAEHFADFVDQRSRRERLLQESGVGQKLPVLLDGIFGIARDIQHLDPRP